jgi:SRSO17 transposase
MDTTLPAATALYQFVDTAKLRWRIERDYGEPKQELASATLKGEAGAGSTITQRYASRLTAS